MKWIVVTTSCLCIISLVAVGRALPIRRSASSSEHHHSSHDELGDMHLFPYQQQMLEDMEHGKTKRELLYSAIPWPNNTIPYRIDPKIVGTKYERAFKKAIDAWKEYTCIKFVKRTNERFYVTLTSSKYCGSYVGKPPHSESHYNVELGEKCHSPGNAMHELGHVLGFYHEHQRQDRDQYITINEAGIENSTRAKDSYRIIHSDNLQVKYDYASVMHYGKRAFAKDKEVAFRLNKSKKVPTCLPGVGQRKFVSKRDIEQINKFYKCPAYNKVLETLDECGNPLATQPRRKNIKTGNKISLGFEDENKWVSCRTGRCFKAECKASFDKNNRRKRNTFTTLSVCTDHQFKLRTTISRKSPKVKVGDNITLEWKPNKFLDCSSMSGACSMTKCNQMDVEGSIGSEECPNQVFRIASEFKQVGEIVQTFDHIQLEYMYNGNFLDCSGTKCMVRPHNGCKSPSRVTDDGKPTDKDQETNCQPPSFIIQK